MAKALYGFHAGRDPRLEAELATLRARVRELEAQVAELRGADDVRLVDEDLDLALLSASDAALV
jgi:cell division protein FtsB